MIDGGRDKAGIGKHLSDIVMADKGTAPAVRDDDKREFCLSRPPPARIGQGPAWSARSSWFWRR